MIAISFEQRLVLIGGTAYAGENKKSVFSVLNYLLPGKGVMPMHCSANHAAGDPDDVAVFFGLSGTGKTTLSADPARVLIGDDEHGWSDDGTFNFEGGCYAKTINLCPKAEPEIYATTTRFGTVVENMVYDPVTRALDFDDDSLTANTRCAYPLEAISNASPTARGGAAEEHRHADLRRLRRAAADRAADPGAGDVPLPVGLHLQGRRHRARRDRAAADLLHLLRRAFMPRRPEVYGALLRDKIAAAGAACWLVNTGWTGGAYGDGRAHADRGHPGAAHRRARRLAERRGLPPRPELRLRGAGRGAGRRRRRCSTRAPPGPTPPPTTPRRRSSSRCSPTNFAQYEAHVGDDVRAAAVKAA